MPVTSTYWWDNVIHHDNETLLMIESKEAHFDAINALVGHLHSYKDYVITSVPVTKTTPGVLAWINEATS